MKKIMLAIILGSTCTMLAISPEDDAKIKRLEQQKAAEEAKVEAGHKRVADLNKQIAVEKSSALAREEASQKRTLDDDNHQSGGVSRAG